MVLEYFWLLVFINVADERARCIENRRMQMSLILVKKFRKIYMLHFIIGRINIYIYILG